MFINRFLFPLIMNIPLPPKDLATRLLARTKKGRLKKLGDHHNVFVVTPEVVAKQAALTDAKGEYEIGTFLHDNHVPVPRMYGVLPIRSTLFRYKEQSTESYLFMEYLHGIPSRDVPYDMRRKVLRKYNKTMKLIRSLDVVPRDVHSGNMIYVAGQNELYFLDFTSWRFSQSREVLEYTIESCLKVAEMNLFR